MMALAPSFSAVKTHEAATASCFESDLASICSRFCLGLIQASVFLMIPVIISTDSTGYCPFADSPESITASAPSNTALVTSETSARVGLGFFCIDSSICVATTTGLPEAAARQRLTISFCQMTTSSSGTSTPRSPRATMIPSAASVISSKFSRASVDSILAIIRACGCDAGQNSAWHAEMWARIWWTSSALRTKDAATKSMSFSIPYRMSSKSLGDMAGKSTFMPGKLTPRLEAMLPSFSTRHLTAPVVASTSSTAKLTAPSSRRIVLPTVAVDPSEG
mmetsp:Transcript_54403/g.124018  ORF Transcript_54403/g.124018 Transcript_54403/m.124018 type:complete len:278 (+) Transcript_54403:418-1251(+)